MWMQLLKVPSTGRALLLGLLAAANLCFPRAFAAEPPAPGQSIGGRALQQAPAGCFEGSSDEFQLRVAAVMLSCCPGGTLECDLPASCGSTACSNEFLPFFADCGGVLGELGLPKAQYAALAASCEHSSSCSSKAASPWPMPPR